MDEQNVTPTSHWKLTRESVLLLLLVAVIAFVSGRFLLEKIDLERYDHDPDLLIKTASKRIREQEVAELVKMRVLELQEFGEDIGSLEIGDDIGGMEVIRIARDEPSYYSTWLELTGTTTVSGVLFNNVYDKHFNTETGYYKDSYLYPPSLRIKLDENEDTPFILLLKKLRELGWSRAEYDGYLLQKSLQKLENGTFAAYSVDGESLVLIRDPESNYETEGRYGIKSPNLKPFTIHSFKIFGGNSLTERATWGGGILYFE